ALRRPPAKGRNSPFRPLRHIGADQARQRCPETVGRGGCFFHWRSLRRHQANGSRRGKNRPRQRLTRKGEALRTLPPSSPALQISTPLVSTPLTIQLFACDSPSLSEQSEPKSRSSLHHSPVTIHHSSFSLVRLSERSEPKGRSSFHHSPVSIHHSSFSLVRLS